MNEKLVAHIVSFDEDDDVAVFAFSAEEGESSRYVMLQYPLHTDEQDRRLRLDGLYIERDDQAFGCHHGVESIRRHGDRIEIEKVRSELPGDFSPAVADKILDGCWPRRALEARSPR